MRAGSSDFLVFSAANRGPFTCKFVFLAIRSKARLFCVECLKCPPCVLAQIVLVKVNSSKMDLFLRQDPTVQSSLA